MLSKAEEILISAYEHQMRKPESAGDMDLNTAGDRVRSTRKPKYVTFGDSSMRVPAVFSDPVKYKAFRQSVINTSHRIANSLQQGKIISEAERASRGRSVRFKDDRAMKALSRFIYCPGGANRSDLDHLQSYLQKFNDPRSVVLSMRRSIEYRVSKSIKKF